LRLSQFSLKKLIDVTKFVVILPVILRDFKNVPSKYGASAFLLTVVIIMSY